MGKAGMKDSGKMIRWVGERAARWMREMGFLRGQVGGEDVRGCVAGGGAEEGGAFMWMGGWVDGGAGVFGWGFSEIFGPELCREVGIVR